MWGLHFVPHERGVLLFTPPAGALLILLAPLGPAAPQLLAAVLAAVVAVTVAVTRRGAAQAG